MLYGSSPPSPVVAGMDLVGLAVSTGSGDWVAPTFCTVLGSAWVVVGLAVEAGTAVLLGDVGLAPGAAELELGMLKLDDGTLVDSTTDAAGAPAGVVATAAEHRAAG